MDRTHYFYSSGFDVGFPASGVGGSSVVGKVWGDASRLQVHDGPGDLEPNRQLSRQTVLRLIACAGVWNGPARVLHHNGTAIRVGSKPFTFYDGRDSVQRFPLSDGATIAHPAAQQPLPLTGQSLSSAVAGAPSQLDPVNASMQWLNVSYGVWFSRRHNRAGHSFQGRFKALTVQDDAGWQELARYVHLNPVRVAVMG